MERQAQQRELALRAHIRNILLEYSLIHLSTNYVTWTQDIATELLSEGLSYVPTADPVDLRLPCDPYESLSRIWKLEKMEAYNETWKSDVQVPQFIKTRWQMLSCGERPSKKCWDTDSDADHEHWLNLRPMSPVLSMTSVRQTPKLGTLAGTKTIPRTWKDVIKSSDLKSTPSDDLPEEPLLKLEDVLDLRHSLDRQTHQGIATLFRDASALSKRSISDVHQKAKDFLRADSPPGDSPPPLASPPIFARDRRPGYTLASPGNPASKFGPAVLTDLPSIVPVVTSEKDDDIYMQHMVVVDGWQTYAVPSSPLTPGTPSLRSSSGEIDELFLPSPPEHDRPLIEELMDAQLDEYEMPRSQKVGGTQEKPEIIGHGQSLSSFLSPLRRRHNSLRDQAKIVTTPKSQPSSPHTAITASMLGQPPTTFDGEDGTGGHARQYALADPPSEGSDPDMDAMLRRIYGADTATANITQLIMNENLDEGESMLMDVPVMPPPNEHAPGAMFLPSQTAELLAPSKNKPDQADNRTVSLPTRSGYLKKVKGMQALTIELSWIPFKFGSSVPTDAEVSGVADNIETTFIAELQEEDSALVQGLTELLDSSLRLQDCLDGGQAAPSTLRCLDDGWDSLDRSLEDEAADVDIVLTRDERKSLQSASYSDNDLGSSDKENEGFLIPSVEEEEEEEDRPPAKRARTTEEQYDFCYGDPDQEVPATDDSGVFLSSSEAMPNGYAGGFAELGHSAQGFEGSSADGDLFGDIDPVYEIGFADAAATYAIHAPPRGKYARSLNASDTNASRRSGEHARTEINARLAEVHVGEPMSGTAQDITALAASPRRSATTPSVRHSLAEFLSLMGNKAVTSALGSSPPAAGPSEVVSPAHSSNEAPEPMGITVPVVPAGLLGSDTLCLPEAGLQPATVHRYMASVALLQKRALFRCLSSECCVDLIEREDLGDADLILDPETAVSFTSLAALPAQVDTVLARLTRLSWRYSRILLVLQAYPDSLSFKRDLASPRPVPYPFSAAVMKAVKKLRRDLNIAEACETKKAGSAVCFAFALSVEEAASYARSFGDDAEAMDTTQGALWGSREWLDFDEQEGESDLAGVEGMNAFAASIILSQMSLDDFLDTSPEDRVQYFGPYVGHERLVRFNEELQRRAQAVELTPSSPNSYEAS
ncbi:hypothetical protein DAEQUDRAFT_552793 [Daedalea quercina L-15889]|uniref:Uncharacterized protein n=1 Tax=Daedalea quercina L-15889 TaxID=1314783 RepID=A0A165T453_9APHY|nr:hypothetical protein DAEQUDRAFT_552793 [Daedalea quercina L-15889]